MSREEFRRKLMMEATVEDYDLFMYGVFAVMGEFHCTYEYVMTMPATRYLSVGDYLTWKSKETEKMMEQAKHKR